MNRTGGFVGPWLPAKKAVQSCVTPTTPPGTLRGGIHRRHDNSGAGSCCRVGTVRQTESHAQTGRNSEEPEQEPGEEASHDAGRSLAMNRSTSSLGTPTDDDDK